LINNRDELTSKEKPTEEGKEQKKVKTKTYLRFIYIQTQDNSYQMMLHKTLQTDTSSSNR
jgi:hypothetical protein